MAFSPQDFADDTEFERFALTLLGAHRIRPARSQSFDVRGRPQGAVIEVSGTASMGSRRIDEFKASLRVLGFGMAYKILDLLVEGVLRDNGAPSGHLDFKYKKNGIGRKQRALPVPFDAHPEYWDRLAALYGEFLDARHGVVHGMGGATSSGDLKYATRKSAGVVSSGEIIAFMAATHGAADLTIERSSERRTLRILAWHLNALRVRHGFADLPADDPSAGVGRIVADLAALADGRMRVDVRRLRGTVQSQEQHRSTWDLELHGDGRVFVGSWEDVPDQGADTLDFDPAMPPSWLAEQLEVS